MLIARNKYSREINARKEIAKEMKINKLGGLEKFDPKTFWKSILNKQNQNRNYESNITDDEWLNYFGKL